MYYLENMIKNLSENDEELLKLIYEPKVVAVPPCDACRSIAVAPDGEIRIYGSINRVEQEDVGTGVYISSYDCGLSWKTKLLKSNKTLCAAGYNPKTGRYISSYPDEYRRDAYEAFGLDGTWAILNDEGFGSENNRFVKLTDKHIHIMKQPYFFEDIDRWIILGQYRKETGETHITVSYSDDDGESWTTNILEKYAPVFEVKPPHKGLRWEQYSCEPSMVKLDGGEMVMIVRTAQDYHYKYRSLDNGETWTGPEITNFHGTITMPLLYKLSDGRILFFWCNTQPLAELDHEKTWPELDPDAKKGIWEDVFTNRDANHLAVSEDNGKTWRIRELYLNPLRNNADFRSAGGPNSHDKSVHQAQIAELPFNKILIHFGQNDICRRVVILDLDWLYETERHEDFRFGLANVSTHMYVKSNLGNYRGFSGHCAYNRTNGALLVQDPDGNSEEALQICRVEDERLVYKKQGVVWNFPASGRGEVAVKLRVNGNGVAVSLSDRWFNACDEYAPEMSHISFNMTEKTVNGWDVLTIKYDTAKMFGEIYINSELVKTVQISLSAPYGLSYLHIQTLAESEDTEGTLIKRMDKLMWR